MQSRRIAFLLCLVLVLLTSSAFAQEITGSISGTVKDPSGAAIPNASVTVTNVDTSTVMRSMQSKDDGGYVATTLPIGKYSVSAEASGFKKTTVSNIELNVNERLTINLNMQVGAQSEVVEVEADPLQVELQTATSSPLMTGDQIRELSLNNRYYAQLISLLPGVTYGGGDQIYIGTTNPSGETNVVSFSINGQRNSANSWTVDGADNVDRGSNLTLLNYPSVDAIAEFKVLRGIYTAEFGRASSGHVNVITKSGTKDFHGSAYEYVRNDIFNANTYINKNLATPIARPPLRYNNFGYTIGGPIIIPGVWEPQTKKTFFFFSQEYRRQNVPGTFTAVVPTAAEKAGNFTRLVCTAPNTYTTACVGPTGMNIPVINPIAQQYITAIWGALPEPNVPGTHNFIGTRQSVFNHRQELVKVDHVFSPRWSISGRFLNDKIPTVEPGGLFTGAVLPGVSTTSTNSPGRGWVFRSVNSFSPTWLLETGYAFSYGAIISDPVGTISSVNSPGISTPLPFPSTLGRVPSVTFTNGASNIAGFGPYDNFNRNHNIYGNVSKQFVKHTFKFGGTYNHYQKTENAAGNDAGTFNFNANGAVVGVLTGNALADARFQQAWANFLVGDVNTYSQASLDLTPDVNANQFEFYVQDDWKVKPNLTVNLGVRYSMFRQPHDNNGFFTNFDPSAYDPARAPVVSVTTGNITSAAGTFDPQNGIIVNGVNSPFGDKVAAESTMDWAPRIGFAWDPWSTGKTAIRGGYGISYDSGLVGILEQNVFANRPFVQNISISNTRFENAAAAAPVISAVPVSLRGTPVSGQTPYVQSWSLDFQHEFWAKTLVAIGYYGNKGTHLIGIGDINQPLPGQLQISGGVPIVNATSPHINAVRPFRGYGPINAVLPLFTSNYNGMQVSGQKRFKGKSQISVSYTWSKALTTAQTDRSSAPQNIYDLDGEYGPSQLDRRHVFNTNYVYEFPWFKDNKGILGWTVGGWQATGIVLFYSGLPLTIITGGLDPAGQGYNLATSTASGRPDLIGDPEGPQGTDNITGPVWLNTAAWAPVCPSVGICAVSRPGTSGRGVARGPGFQRVDFSLFKNFAFSERWKLQFRTETFNLFNHTNPNGVNVTQTSTSFGRITSYRSPREMQFGLKLSF